jgi:transcriptional regulator of heat shock response
MAQRKPDAKDTMTQVLKLVAQLSPEELEELRRQLNSRTWGERWDELSNTIRARFIANGIQIPTDEEIMADVKAVRNERKERLAQGSN